MNTVDKAQGAIGPDRLEAAMANTSKGPSKIIWRKIDKIKDVFVRHQKICKPTDILESNPAPTDVVFDFAEYLNQNLLLEACQQLLLQEDVLFGQETVAADELDGVSKEEAADLLQKDNEALLLRLQLAVNATFSSMVDGEHLKTLRSAVDAMVLQEQQDRHWESLPSDSYKKVPVWRPTDCWFYHDTILKGLVKSRLTEAAEEDNVSVSSVDDLSSSVKREVCRMGMRLTEDLLKVVRDVEGCYPADFGVCNRYMGLYHQEFSARLTKLAQSELNVDDCSYILSWVNNFYPNDILKREDFEGHVNCTSLGTLLSEKDLTRLEEQYLLSTEEKVRTWMAEALRKEEKGWLSGKRPELIDGYCCCPLAIDVIQVVHGTMRSTGIVLGSESKAQRILCQLDSFLKSFQRSLKECVMGRKENTHEAMKANLFSIEQFSDFIMNEKLMPNDVKKSCTSTLEELRDCGYRYFTGPIHEELKVHYRQLWTQVWFTGDQRALDDITDTLDRHVQQLTDLNPICKEKLLGRIQVEVTTEYVRRMMKRKLRLRDQEQQEAAADMLLADNKTLTNYFTEKGSQTSWLNKVLHKLAEVIKLQDTGSIHLEIVTLVRDYPDVSWSHISALLYLKVHLSKDDIHSIKKSQEENRSAITASSTNPPFFSMVQATRKWLNKP